MSAAQDHVGLQTDGMKVVKKRIFACRNTNYRRGEEGEGERGKGVSNGRADE